MTSLITGFSPAFIDKSKSDVNAWYDIYNLVYHNVIHVDRFGDTKFPYNFQCVPELKLNVSRHDKTFDECCLARAKEIKEYAEANNYRLGLFYSGGIDSTAILTAFMRVMSPNELKNNLIIFMNMDSIAENPSFYFSKIRNFCTIESSEQFSAAITNKSLLIIDGEHNDQLFGADLVASIVREFGFSFIHAPCTRENIVKCFLRVNMSQYSANLWYDVLIKSARNAPTPIETVYNFFWWINFNFKWQSVFFRIAIRNANNSERLNIDINKLKYQHFFAGDDLQNWSIFNNDKKIGQSWSSYKLAAKQFIYDFHSDKEYFDHKLKMPSLSFLFFAKTVPLAVDSGFNPHYTIDPSVFHVTSNDFIT